VLQAQVRTVSGQVARRRTIDGMVEAGGGRERDRPGWWVFDRPFQSDPLVWATVAAGAITAIVQTILGENLVMAAISVVQGALFAAIVLGSVRAYRRASAPTSRGAVTELISDPETTATDSWRRHR
jgi:hypothetical protein